MKALLSLSLIFAGISAAAAEPTALEVTGFKKVKESKTCTTFMFRDDFKYTISKQTFSKWQDAQKFCSRVKGSKIGDIEHMLLIAMSGGATADETLKQSIVFNFSHPKDKSRKLSGIMGWVTEDAKQKLVKMGRGDDVVVMFDGRGTDTQSENLSNINKGITSSGLKAHRLHAVCVQSFEKKETPKVETPAEPSKDVAPVDGAT